MRPSVKPLSLVVLALLVWGVPSRPASAQVLGTIAGVIQDISGSVLPGVTVEASSPALIEKVRSATSDGSGQYRIVSLPVGTYRVTFTLPGFSTTIREGIEIGANVTTTVTAEMRVGAVTEAITVTAEAPIVDVQNTTTNRSLSATAFKEIPSAGTWTQMAALIVGVQTNIADVGGSSGDSVGATLTAHGSTASEQNQMIDGLKIGNLQVQGARTNLTVSPLLFDEVTVQLSGGSGAGNGVALNAIPKAGGNTISGAVLWNGSTGDLQADNLTDRLQARGITASNTLRRLQDLNGSVGGPIQRDRVWFFATSRWFESTSYLAGLYFPADVTAIVRSEDRSRQGYEGTIFKDVAGRVTFAATSSQKLTGFYVFQKKCQCFGGINALTSPEATFPWRWPIQMTQVGYTNVLTSRLLFESGFNLSDNGVQMAPREGDPEGLIRIVEQGGAIAAPITYRAPGNIFNQKLTQWFGRAALSYTTGSHSLKGGVEYEGGYQIGNNGNENGYIQYRTRDYIPNQLTLQAPSAGIQSNEDYALGLFVQDQWTTRRLTLNGMLRLDLQRESYAAWTAGPSHWLPNRNLSFPGVGGVVNWKDVNPRFGASYDLFGNGKTAIKVNASRGVVPDGLTLAAANAPGNTLTTSVPRNWTDEDGDFIADCDQRNPAANGECGAYLNATFGQPVPGTTYDPAVLKGWHVRPYNWEFTTSIQQQVLPRLGVTVGYFRRISGNFRVTDNILTAASDYTQFSVVAPNDNRLPNPGAPINGVFDVSPALVSAVQNRVMQAADFGRQYEHWNGVDVSVDVRPRNGLSLNAGVSTGERMTDICDIAAKVPESLLGAATVNGANAGVWTPLQDCHQESGWLPQLKGLASYQLPWGGVRLSTAIQSVTGPQELANVIYTGAQLAPIIGRPFSSGQTGQATVSVIEPGTEYGDRLTQIDIRATKLVNFRGARLDLNFDLYNLLNSDAVLTQSNAFGAAWLRPTTIVQGRFVKFGVRMDF
jgi:Carboxypeptidase regulatory-like domain